MAGYEDFILRPTLDALWLGCNEMSGAGFVDAVYPARHWARLAGVFSGLAWSLSVTSANTVLIHELGFLSDIAMQRSYE